MVFGGKVFPNRRVWRFFRLFVGRPISPVGLNTGFCFFGHFAHLRRQRRHACGGNVPEYAPASLELASLYLHQTGKKARFAPYCPLGNTGFYRPIARWAIRALYRPISLSLNTGSGFGYCPLGNTPTLFLRACTKRNWRGLRDDIHLTSPPAYRPPPLHEWRGGIDRFTWMGGPVPPAMGRGYSPQPLTGFMWIVGYYIPKWSIQLMVCALNAHHFLDVRSHRC